MDLKVLEKYYKEGWLIKQHHPNLPLTIWNYSQQTQYEGKWDDITLICRGLVTLDETGEVVARPFKKFFNIEEAKHTPTKDFDVYEKVDGSLGILFNYNNKWIFASRGSFTSEQCIKFKEIFYKNYDDLLLSRSNTYLFEIIYPENRIVVDYGNKESITMIGGIHTYSGDELDLEFNSELGFEVVKTYDGIKDYTELKNNIKDNQEGYVIRFSNGDRCKIKGEEYCRLHKIMAETSTTSVWECLKNGDSVSKILENVPDEFFNKIKEYEVDLKHQFNTLKTQVYNEYKIINFSLGECDNKTFALFIKDNPYKKYMFSLRNNKDIDYMIWKKIKPKFKKL